MQLKKKTCAGFDGKEHEDYIYKNIDGKKYCKSCTFKLQPPKSIKKVSEKGKFKMILKKEQFEEDKKFYTSVWIARFFEESTTRPGTYNMKKAPRCENTDCNVRLPDEPNLCFFHHILEKRNYPEWRHDERNIAVLCPDCHNKYETFPDSVPYLVRLKKYLLQIFKTKISEEQEH